MSADVAQCSAGTSGCDQNATPGSRRRLVAAPLPKGVCLQLDGVQKASVILIVSASWEKVHTVRAPIPRNKILHVQADICARWKVSRLNAKKITHEIRPHCSAWFKALCEQMVYNVELGDQSVMNLSWFWLRIIKCSVENPSARSPKS